jgi:hypothetical protein
MNVFRIFDKDTGEYTGTTLYKDYTHARHAISFKERAPYEEQDRYLIVEFALTLVGYALPKDTLAPITQNKLGRG